MANFRKHLWPLSKTAALILPLLMLSSGGLWFYQAEKTSARKRAEQQLTAVAHAKVDQLAAWRAARRHDAVLITENPSLLQQVLLFLGDPQGTRGEELRRQLRVFQQHGDYAELLLVDRDGRVRLNLNGQRDEFKGHGTVLTEALRSGRALFTEFHREPRFSKPLVSLVAPLFSGESRTPLGALVLVNDAAQYLHPVLHAWVKPSATMEVMLVSRDREAEVLLNAFPERPETMTSLPPHPDHSLESLAVSGSEGFLEGRDHRGVESLAVLLPVPDSNWVLIAKDDVAEFYGVWRFRAALLMLLFSMLSVGVSGLALFVWQLKRRKYYQALYTTEAQLRHSLERHRITLQAIGDGIVVVDRHGRVELLNPVAETLTGWSHEMALGKSLADVFFTVDEAMPTGEQGPATAILHHEGATDGCRQLLLRARNGAERAISVAISPMCDEQGTTIGTVLAVRDRTEERRTQRLVRTRLVLREYAVTHTLHEFLTRALQEIAMLVASPLVVFRTAEPDTRTVTVRRPPSDALPSNCAEDGAEFGDEPGIGEGWPDILQHLRPVIRNRLDQGDDGIEGTGDRRFGTRREMLVPVLRHGKVIAVLGAVDKPEEYTEDDADLVGRISEDIWRLVEQKRIEEALLASERRYRTLYRSMMDAFVVTDMLGNIRECNDAYGAMLGYTIAELKQLSVRDLTPASWLAFENEHIRKQLMHGGCSSLYEKEYRRKDGTVFPVELRTFLILNNDGIPEGMSAVVRDVTERKQAEEEREKLRERLNQSQKMESVGQLAGGVAHDFNNMLSVILGYAELASRKINKSDPLHKCLREIVSAARRSAEITRQLLAFARKQTIAPRIVDLNETMAGMLKMLQRLIGENIKLHWLPGKDLWPVLMDPSQVDQLLANLCVNARDALKNGVGKITIETGKATFDAAYCAERAGFSPGDFVLLAVSDNGCGIERDILDKIFEPFFTTKGIGEGTGLGLATVYGIVKQNNGFINVYSEPGEGTTFRLYLPRAEGQSETVGEENAVALQPAGRGETILVVEDDAAILALNQTMLEYLGYTVLAASTPRKALQLARWHARTIRLLLTDVIMPEMNGRELAKEVRFFCPSLKVLFVSGYTANVIAHRQVLDEGVCFLAKPFSADELAAKIRETLAANG